jgi:hypothetical protein
VASDLFKGAISRWAQWRNQYLHFGDLVCLRACDGSLLTVQLDSESKGGDLVGGSRDVNAFSLFRIVDPQHKHWTTRGRTLRADADFGLRNIGCANFVGANFDHQATLTCYSSDRLDAWETLRLKPVNPDSSGALGLRFGTEVNLSIFSRYRSEQWCLLQYRKNSSRKVVRANATRARSWECFVIVDPAKPQ